MVEGMNSIMIYCKNFCIYHNLPQYNNNSEKPKKISKDKSIQNLIKTVCTHYKIYIKKEIKYHIHLNSYLTQE
jgi:hypothetical protein